MILTYLLLGIAIVAVWWPSLRVSGVVIVPWAILLVAAVASGLAVGILSWPALLPLVAFALLVWIETHIRLHSAPASASTPPRATLRRNAGAAAAGAISLALALHLLPGFHNPALVASVSVSHGAPPMTQYLNFDKGIAGLFLLAYCRRFGGIDDVRCAVPATLTTMLVTPTVVLGIAVVVGYVQPDPKFPPFALAFLATNLLFTCVPEEAFFRGLLQPRLFRVLPVSNTGRTAAVAVSALLFGLAHAAGGVGTAALATLAGLGYASAYATTGRIESAILTHFTLNAVHFLGFTYPHLLR